MHSLFEAPTAVDATDDTSWSHAHSTVIAVVRVTAELRADYPDIHRGARWAVLDHDTYGREWALADNLDHVVNPGGIVRWAWAIAAARGVTVALPPSMGTDTCRYCLCPVPTGYQFCPDTDCHLSHGANETGWRA